MIRAAVLGATGVAGQQFLGALARHPWFRVTALGASPRSAGKRYIDAISDAAGAPRWYVSEELTPELSDMVVTDASDLAGRAELDVDVVFSALESEAARQLEPMFARHVPVLSTASATRMEADVPLLLPGVNWDHAQAIARQQAGRGWRGFVAPGPNCTTVGLAMTLAPLDRAWGAERVLMTSLQAVSGAGRSPGVASLDIIDNVVPFISGEEAKVESETRKILGRWTEGGFEPHPVRVSCTCTRVPVLDGHTETVFASFRQPPDVESARRLWTEHGAELRALELPSFPASTEWIHVSSLPDRPQPRLDRDRGGGLTTSVGRVRPDPALDNGLKWVLLSHNTRMGAAHGSLLTAEYLVRQGFIGERSGGR